MIIIAAGQVANQFLLYIIRKALARSGRTQTFQAHRPYKESLSKEMNNDDLNLHSIQSTYVAFSCRCSFNKRKSTQLAYKDYKMLNDLLFKVLFR